MLTKHRQFITSIYSGLLKHLKNSKYEYNVGITELTEKTLYDEYMVGFNIDDLETRRTVALEVKQPGVFQISLDYDKTESYRSYSNCYVSLESDKYDYSLKNTLSLMINFLEYPYKEKERNAEMEAING